MIAFSPTTNIRNYASYSDWLTAFGVRGGSPQADGDNGQFWNIWVYDHNEVHLLQLWMVPMPDSIAANYPGGQAQATTDLADFTANLLPMCNGAITPKTSDNRPRTASEKSTLTRLTIYAFNWADPTTWYCTSRYVAGETATDGGAHTLYTLANPYVIDTYHGKIMGEDSLVDASNLSYRVNVYLNSVVKTEQDPSVGSGGDYTIDYATGSITFLTANGPSDVVTADYHYMVDSTFIVAPPVGRSLIIDMSEATFTSDIVMNDTIVSQPYGLVDVFAPGLMPGIPSGTKIPLGDPIVYKTMANLIADADQAGNLVGPMGGSGWRGLGASQSLLWNYATSSVLFSADGMEIRISLQHNTKFGGTYGSSTFYCLLGN